MVFWIGILIGGLFVWFALKTGFYEMWALVFNLVISIFLAINLRSAIAELIPAISDTPYSSVLTILAIAIASFAILHGLTYVFLTSQFSISFPKVFDVLGTGLLGFLAGFLIWSFLSFLICITPLWENEIIKSIGFDIDSPSQQTSISYISWWCDLVGAFVSDEDSKHTTEQTINELIEKIRKEAQAKRARQAEPNEPAEQTLPCEPNEPAKPNKSVDTKEENNSAIKRLGIPLETGMEEL